MEKVEVFTVSIYLPNKIIPHEILIIRRQKLIMSIAPSKRSTVFDLVFVLFFNIFYSSSFFSRCKIPSLANDTFKIQNGVHADLANLSIPRISASSSESSAEFRQCLVYTDDWRYAQEDGELWGTLFNSTSPAAAEDGRNSLRVRETRQCHEWVYDRSEFDSTAITEVCVDISRFFVGVQWITDKLIVDVTGGGGGGGGGKDQLIRLKMER